jgi:hypothetical protein
MVAPGSQTERHGTRTQTPQVASTPRLAIVSRAIADALGVCCGYWEASPPSLLRFAVLVACWGAAAFINGVAMCVSSFSMASSRSSMAGVSLRPSSTRITSRACIGSLADLYKTQPAARLPAGRTARLSFPKRRVSWPLRLGLCILA